MVFAIGSAFFSPTASLSSSSDGSCMGESLFDRVIFTKALFSSCPLQKRNTNTQDTETVK